MISLPEDLLGAELEYEKISEECLVDHPSLNRIYMLRGKARIYTHTHMHAPVLGHVIARIYYIATFH